MRKRITSLLLAIMLLAGMLLPVTGTAATATAPGKTKITSLTANVKGFTVKYKKVSDADGYNIQYSTKSSMSGAKTKTITSKKTVSKKITGLSAGKKYYVKVRAYKTVDGKKVYSKWTAKKSVTTKKEATSKKTTTKKSSSGGSVYITRTGSKYHRCKCGNGNYYQVSLSEAKSRGLTPCSKCY